MAVPILWRNRRQRYSLEGERCPACARAIFPPRQVCPYCSREQADQERAAAQDSLGPILALPELRFDPHRFQQSQLPHAQADSADDHLFLMPHELKHHTALREAGDD